MRKQHKRWIFNFVIIVMAIAVSALFQNCTNPNVYFSNANSSGSGGGFDGLRYQNYAVCPSTQQVDVSNILEIAADFSSANLIRSNCQDLATPQPLNVNDLIAGIQNPNVVIYNNQIYDFQGTGTSNQQVTTIFCTGVSGAIAADAYIWRTLGTPALFGMVSLTDGTQTGALSIQPGATGSYSSGAGAVSLSIDIGTPANPAASVTYSMTSGPSATFTGADCITQPLPPSATGTAATQVYTWAQSGFGSCSATCGGGTQTQTVTCTDSNGNTVSNSLCTSPQPPVSRPCGVQACPVGHYGDCDMEISLPMQMPSSSALIADIATASVNDCASWCVSQSAVFCTYQQIAGMLSPLCSAFSSQALPAQNAVRSPGFEGSCHYSNNNNGPGRQGFER